MNPGLETQLRPSVERAMRDGRLPGLALLVAHNNAPIEYLILGTDATGEPLSRATWFNIASISKLALALAILRLVDSGLIGLDDSLAPYLPDAVVAANRGVSLRRLLSHTAGLPLDLPEGAAPYGPMLTWSALRRACLETTLEAPPGTRVQYSNPGYGLLALVVERVSGLDFPDALQRLVLVPLGAEGRLGSEPPSPPAIVADVRSRHAGTPLEPFNSSFWRSLGLPWGGMTATLDGAFALLRAFQEGQSTLLSPTTRAQAVENQVGELGGGQTSPLIWARCPWGLGPELRDAKTPHWAPDEASPHSFGHAGASGCLAWADPAARVAWVLAGTRTAANGWLLRYGRDVGAAVVKAVRRSE